MDKNNLIKLLERDSKKIIINALKEDLGSGDITTRTIIPDRMKCDAFIFSKEKGIVCGLPIIKRVFKVLDPNATFNQLLKDGDIVLPGQKIIEISGRARSILNGERVALNFLQRLSGIATYVHKFVKKATPFGVKILDTRKTTPGLRILEKYAVRVGGGINHRFGLWDEILIKGNHIELVGLKKAVKRAQKIKKRIEVEVRNLEEVKEALSLGVDIIMLDNMNLKTITRAIKIIGKKARVEVSGGVNLKNIKKIAETRPDWISIGRLTYSAGVLDMSLVVRKKKTSPTKQTYILPEDLRGELRKPIGVVILGRKKQVFKKFKQFISKEKFQRIITVGDYCSFEIPSDVKIFDGKIRRKKIKRGFPYSLSVRNPAGTIQKEVWGKIKTGIKRKKNIFVKGEEDLLVIPSLLTAPENSLVVYGLPGRGICLVKNSSKNKAIFRDLLERFIFLP